MRKRLKRDVFSAGSIGKCLFLTTILTQQLIIPLTALSQDAITKPPIPQRDSDVRSRLNVVSKMHFRGHPVALDVLVMSFNDPPESGLGWGIPTIVDRPALVNRGIHLEEIVVGKLEASGVSRMSSLRFVLERSGIAYYVDDRRLIVTTKEIARAKWVSQLPKPQTKLLQGDDVDQRREVTFAAGVWRLDSDEWVKPLSGALADADRQVRFDAAYALGEFGPEASIAIEPLSQLLRSDDLTLREIATFALGKIGPNCCKTLLELINDPDPAIALAAAKAFTVMGSAGNDAVPGLLAAGVKYANLNSAYDKYERCNVCDALGLAIAQVELGDALPQLQELLDSDSANTRAFAAYAIGEIGPSGQICKPELERLLSDSNTLVRRNAAYAMARLDLPADTSTTALEAAAKDSDRNVKLWATSTLQKIRSKK